MAAHDITLSDDALLAEYVPLDDFRGWAEQRVAVNPDLLTVLIRNGQVVSSGQGGNVAIGGFWRGIKDAMIGEHSLRLLIADLKPFQMIAGVNAVSRDKVPVGGEITIEFQIDPEKGSGVLGLMREHSAVYKDEIMARLAPHIGDRVIEAVVGKMDAADLRGSTMMQDKVQAEVMREVERIAGDMSLMVRNVSMRWEINPEEIHAMEMRAMERDQARADAELSALTREMARADTVTELRIKSDLSEEKVKAASEDELRAMVLSQELAFADARDTGTRIEEMKALRHEIDKIKTERTAKLEDKIANTTNDLELAKLRQQISAVEGQTEEAETERRLRLQKLERVQNRELGRDDQLTELEIADLVRKQQLEKLEGLQDLDLREARGKLDISESGKDGDTDRAIRLAKANAEAEIEKLKLQGNMTPEMLLALAAGNSPEAATALVEVAKAKASDPGNSAEMMKLVQSSIDATNRASDSKDEQNRHALDTIAKATIGVAEGAGGGARPAVAAEIACSSCGKPEVATAKFCRHCGTSLRT